MFIRLLLHTLSVFIILGIIRIICRRRFVRPTAILLDLVLSSVFVFFKVLDFLAVHVLHDGVGLPFLKAEAEAFVGVVLCKVLEWTSIGVRKRKEGEGLPCRWLGLCGISLG